MRARIPDRVPTGVMIREGGSGSSIVVAVVLATVLAALAGAAAARAVGTVRAAVGSEERAVARSIAELGTVEAVRMLGSPENRRATLLRSAVGPDPTAASVAALEALHPSARVTVTMRAGPAPDERTIEVAATVGEATHVAHARVRPFLTADHLLILEHRGVDPVLLHLPRGACAWSIDDARRDPGCRVVPLEGGAPDGPVHLNDASSDDEALGDGPLTTFVRDPSRHRPEITLPRTVNQVIGEATVTCRFRGPTSIRFDGSVIRVRSPRSVPRPGEMIDVTAPIGCMGVDRSSLSGTVAIALPDDATVEVVRDGDAGCDTHPLGIGDDEDLDRGWSCTSGDAFVWGRYSGRRTILAEDDVQVVWDVEPGDASSAAPLERGDLLGLVAGDSIVLRRLVGSPIRRIAPLGRNLPVAGPGLPPFGEFPLDAPTSVATTWEQPRIVAAMAALRGSVTIQNPRRGQSHAGLLEIVGSIAARFPGLLAWEERTSSGALVGASGYRVVLSYDRRLLDDAPPLLPMTDAGGVRIIHRELG